MNKEIVELIKEFVELIYKYLHKYMLQTNPVFERQR